MPRQRNGGSGTITAPGAAVLLVRHASVPTPPRPKLSPAVNFSHRFRLTGASATSNSYCLVDLFFLGETYWCATKSTVTKTCNKKKPASSSSTWLPFPAHRLCTWDPLHLPPSHVDARGIELFLRKHGKQLANAFQWLATGPLHVYGELMVEGVEEIAVELSCVRCS